MLSDKEFKTSYRERERQREYRRLKKLGGGDYWEGCRIDNDERRWKMSPYDLGVEDANLHKSAVERYNAHPPNLCPFVKGTPEEAEYDRGWKDALHK